MKVKLDFVTNSSSSSFVIFGVCLDKMKLDEILQEKIDELYMDDGLEHYSETEDGNIIGVSPREIQNHGDRKINEIGQIVAEILEKKIGLKVDPKDVKFYSGEYQT